MPTARGEPMNERTNGRKRTGKEVCGRFADERVEDVRAGNLSEGGTDAVSANERMPREKRSAIRVEAKSEERRAKEKGTSGISQLVFVS